jgi:hypothetical protein
VRPNPTKEMTHSLGGPPDWGDLSGGPSTRRGGCSAPQINHQGSHGIRCAPSACCAAKDPCPSVEQPEEWHLLWSVHLLPVRAAFSQQMWSRSLKSHAIAQSRNLKLFY